MKTWCVLLAVVYVPFFAVAAFAQSGTVTVAVKGVNGAGGLMSIGRYQNEKGWPDKGKEYKGEDVAVAGDTVSHSFVDVPPGTYAVAIFHDANSNLKLDKNFFGVPKEGYGFSNNVFGPLGLPPGFEKASFQLQGDTKVTIQLAY